MLLVVDTTWAWLQCEFGFAGSRSEAIGPAATATTTVSGTSTSSDQVSAADVT